MDGKWFEVAQGMVAFSFIAPAIVGVLIGALIMLVAERINGEKSKCASITITLKFKSGVNFIVVCEQISGIIFCPICDFRNESSYRVSKHLKGHFKKGEGKELFTNQQKTV